jgi:hypothetical protein
MTKQEILNQLNQASHWIGEVVSGTLEDADNQHIVDMLNGIEEAMDLLRSESISVDILSYEEDNQKVYDIEHMVADFTEKLNDLQPDGLSLEIFYS